ncbi:hypothetical protein SCB71_02960 [Herbiconiux sp. KACC 21604]|uniref:hypothetical protein n=1 Tax=unclassified Herbiconiux TaxID=2618217 RepID=UPI0014916BF5|nr:hypothetical protein [Herbiconiux sp. SALV-R1]QJU52359.1 hypothetical protein HL652_00930 [Herbiconiux sp. SALV-R1]WPO87215.1 hypothetical protein SCB71_02960 [Herbiconiux sp. KACC 21604]
MGTVTRRELIRAGAWSVPVVAVAVAAPVAAASMLPAGTVTQVGLYQQFANSVNWTWNATNTTAGPAQLTVTLDLGTFTFGGWLTSAWARSGNVYVANAQVASGSNVGNCTVVLRAPSGTTGVVTATVSASGAQSQSYPFTITIP